jgi:hypothetical protein
MYADDFFCNITKPIVASNNCDKLPGGIEDVRIGCLKFFSSYVEVGCSFANEPGTISGITATDPAVDPPPNVVPFYKVGIKDKTGEHIFGLTYEEDTDTVKRSGTINFEITAKDDATFCAIQEYIGQEVVVAFKYRGSNRWYLEGWKGGLRVQSIEGGSGLDSSRRTNFVISGDDLDALFVRFFTSNDGDTLARIEALTN